MGDIGYRPNVKEMKVVAQIVSWKNAGGSALTTRDYKS